MYLKLFFLVFCLLNVIGSAAAEPQAFELPEEINNRLAKVSLPEEKLKILKRVLIEKSSSDGAKIASINSIEKLDSNDAINVLVDNIAFSYRSNGEIFLPAKYALERKKDRAVDAIVYHLQHIDLNAVSLQNTIALEVQTITKIKGKYYNGFVEEHKPGWSPDMRRVMADFALVD